LARLHAATISRDGRDARSQGAAGVLDLIYLRYFLIHLLEAVHEKTHKDTDNFLSLYGELVKQSN
jgi:hypothetical protein